MPKEVQDHLHPQFTEARKRGDGGKGIGAADALHVNYADALFDNATEMGGDGAQIGATPFKPEIQLDDVWLV